MNHFSISFSKILSYVPCSMLRIVSKLVKFTLWVLLRSWVDIGLDNWFWCTDSSTNWFVLAIFRHIQAKNHNLQFRKMCFIVNVFSTLIYYVRDGDRFLEQPPFCFLPWGCSLFQIRHTHFEFPATFDGKMQKYLFWTGGCQNSNPGPPVCQPGMLPQDQRGFDNSWGLELCLYTYVAGNSNWECPTWNKEHPHGKKQNGVCSRYLSPSLDCLLLWILLHMYMT